MKKIHLATVAALTTTLLAGGISAFADENREIETDNTVQFVPNDNEEIVVVPPETEPEVDPIDPVPPGQTGPLTLAYAPRLMNFGEQLISTQDMAYNMIAETQTSNGETVPYVSFAQVHDIRGTHEGWDLSVDLTDFLSTESGNALTGAQIEFVSPRIDYLGSDQTQAPEAITNQGSSLLLTPGGATVNVMTANNGQGAGVSSVVWGDQADLNAQAADDEVAIVENEAIKLHVPGNTTQDAATYEATMTWTLSSVADDDGETTPEEETPEP